MENINQILLILNTIIDSKLFYSNNNSELFNIIDDFNQLIKEQSSTKIYDFINDDRAKLIIQEPVLSSIRNTLKPENKEIDIDELLYDLDLLKDELLLNFKIIEPISNNLPFDSFESISIDKNFLGNISLDDYSEIRKVIKPLELLILDIKEKGILIPNINIVFDYDSRPIDMINYIGYFQQSQLFVKSNEFKSSTFYHEYFHVMDCELSHILNLADKNETIAFSDMEDYKGKDLELFRNFIVNCDTNDSNKLETGANLSLYFNKHFSNKFNSLQLNEIKEDDLINELETLRGKVYTNGKGINKFSERDLIAKNLFHHINYALGKEQMPKNTIFSLFLQAADLNIEDSYHAKNSEKLARIYQAQFDNKSVGQRTQYKKIYPEGTEYDKLVPKLNEIIAKEFTLIFKREQSLKNLFKFRDKNLSMNDNKNHLSIRHP